MSINMDADTEKNVPNINTYGLTDLGYKIFLDRYALKDLDRSSLQVGDTVIAVLNDTKDMNGKREVSIITSINKDDTATILTQAGTKLTIRTEYLDKPLEINPTQLHQRVAKGVASVETGDKQEEWSQKFEWLMDDWRFIPGGRILTMAGSGHNLSAFNCVSGETLIHTEDGLVQASELAGKKVKVLSRNGIYRESTWSSYGIQQLWEITLKNGDTLYATKDHEWVVSKSGKDKVVTTENLLNQKIPLQHVANIQVDYNDPLFIEGVRHGFVYGDGTTQYSRYNGKRTSATTYVPAFTDPKKNFVSKWFENTRLQPSRDAIVASNLSLEWKELPNTDKGITYLRGFIAGLLASDGHVDNRGSVMLHQSDIEELIKIRRLAAIAGLPVVSINMIREINPWSGEYSPTYKMQFVRAGFVDSNLLLNEKHKENMDISLSKAIAKNKKRQTMRVVSVKQTQRIEEVFCCVEPETHTMVIEGGYLTKQCFVISSPKDSRHGIIETLEEMSEIMSRGGGVGINVSSLRPKNSYVKGVNGRSSGAVSFGALYSFMTGLISQAGSRRGALMIILNDTHPDILSFIDSKKTAGNITNANISVGISDRFMEAVKADADWDLIFPDTAHPGYDEDWDGNMEKWLNSGKPVITYRTIKAREIWVKIIESAWASAEPGLWFRDRANKMSNSYYYDNGHLICTNPCVTGDTVVNTSLGLKTMEELYNTQAEFSVVTDSRFGTDTLQQSSKVFATGVKPIYRLVTSDGYTLKATTNHKIMTSSGWKELGEIQPGDMVHTLNRTGAFGTEGNVRLGRTIGWLVGDGHFSSGRAYLSFYGEKESLAPTFAKYVNEIAGDEETLGNRETYNVGVVNVPTHERQVVGSVRLQRIMDRYGLVEKKLQVPEIVFNGTVDMQAGYLQGLFSADGSVQGNLEKGVSIRLTSISTELLAQVQILLSNFGIKSKIYKFRKMAGPRLMPDGQGGMKEYETQAVHELVISKSNVDIYGQEIGFILKSKVDQLRDIANNRKRPAYKESFTSKVESITYIGDEMVYDLQQPTTHSFIANGLVVHNCGEQSLSANAVCNLGAINLSKFSLLGDFIPQNEIELESALEAIDWDALSMATRYAIRFLDDVIDHTYYVTEANKEQEQGERRVGLGIMGLAELMVRIGIRYGSADSIEFIERIMHFIARESYISSAEIAEEKGSFKWFDAENFLNSGFMQNMDQDVKDIIREKGIRNVTLNTIAPTGCVVPDTIISTGTGLKAINSLGNPNGDQWQNQSNLEVMTDTGLKLADKFYVNGYRQTINIKTHRGYSIEATPNHRIRVLSEDGEYVWRRMDELQTEDTVVLWRDTALESEGVSLIVEDFGQNNINSKIKSLPTKMTPEFSELLGFYMGNGYVKTNGGLHLVVNNQDTDVINHLSELSLSIFGVTPTIEQREGCVIVNIFSRTIAKYFFANRFSKEKGNYGNGALSAFIPSQILASGRSSITSFLRGLFESDGNIHRHVVSLSTVSETLAKQVQIAMLSIGIPTQVSLTTRDHLTNVFGKKPQYQLRTINQLGVASFRDEVGFISSRKNSGFDDVGSSTRGDVCKVKAAVDNFYQASAGLPNGIRQEISGRATNGAMAIAYVQEKVTQYPELKATVLGDLASRGAFFDTIDKIEQAQSNTFDISVPDTNTYIANGFVSHNTTSTMVETSGGIEPYFSFVFFRQGRLGVHEQRVELAEKWVQAYGSEENQELPPFFITAMDLPPEEHVRTMAAAQKWVDSSISKTCNVPNDYTIEQTEQLYMQMYDLGCKGGTIYRDGSRDEQVLHLENPEEKKAVTIEPEAVTATYETAQDFSTRNKRRPSLLNGVTFQVATPYATNAYVTVNEDENRYPYEVFITVGKAGSDLQAQAESIGRLISKSIQIMPPYLRFDGLREIVLQLVGIGGNRSTGFGPNQVRSLPDAIGSSIIKMYIDKRDLNAQAEEQIQQVASLQLTTDSVTATASTVATNLFATVSLNANGNGNHVHSVNGVNAYNNNTRPAIKSMDKASAMTEMCPDCQNYSLVREEGCKHCHNCGYSEC